jgi:anti-sigma factor RsiW
MNCREITEFLEQYVSDELSPDLLAEFETHMHACGNCVTFMTQYRMVIEAAKGCYGPTPAEPPPVPEELVTLILRTLDRER